MAKPRRIVALNLGSQTIGLAEFRTEPRGGLVLQKYGLREALIDPANPKLDEAEVACLSELIAELEVQHCEVNYAIAPQSVFARFVKLPALEKEKIQQIVAFEAQQNVPFPMDEVVWDYQLIRGAGVEQIEVALVAIKADLLNDIDKAVEEATLKTAIVDVGTMALYNAFRYNYDGLDGCSLLVDIGARTSNLLFIESQRVFSRSIPIGGSSVTAVIAREFSEPFAEADFRKKRDGIVRVECEDREPADPEAGRVSELMRSAITRLYAEVVRSISHYCGHQHGHTPNRIFLCGGTAVARFVREFFREKLQLPVEFLNPFRNVTVAPGVLIEELSGSAHLLGEVVGLALRSIRDCPMSFNLRPATVTKRRALERRRPFFVMAAAAIVLAIFGWGFYYARAARRVRAGMEKITTINKPMRAAEEEIDKVRRQAGILDTVSLPLVTAINDRFFWVQLLEDLNARLPKDDIWITQLAPTCGGQPIDFGAERESTTKSPGPLVIDGLLLRGLYLYNPKQQEVVVDYFRNLVGSSFFKIDPNNQARAIKSTIPDNADWTFPYELALDLKTPVKLP
jgi:type IV pilus assembly protein PilM